jgi:hypothetical protein
MVPALTLHIFQKYVSDFWVHFIFEIRLSLPVLFIRQSTALMLSASNAHDGFIKGARERHVEICKLLISARADVNVKDEEYLPLPCTFFKNTSLIFGCILFLKFASHFRFYLSGKAPP